MTWNYANPLEPKAHEIAKESDGYALQDCMMLVAN